MSCKFVGYDTLKKGKLYYSIRDKSNLRNVVQNVADEIGKYSNKGRIVGMVLSEPAQAQMNGGIVSASSEWDFSIEYDDTTIPMYMDNETYIPAINFCDLPEEYRISEEVKGYGL